MPWHRIGASVVIVARRFNPSIVNQAWLVQQGVLAFEDLQTGYVFTEVFAQVPTSRFTLIVIADQLQFVPTGPEEEHQAIIVEKLGTIVARLPETPFHAIGLNFNWHLTPGEEDFSGLTRRLFGNPEKRLFDFFGSPTDHFGAYLSKDVDEFRLKLDVKPVLVANGETKHNALQFVFNFHADLATGAAAGAAAQIQERILKWNELKALAETMLDSIEPRIRS